MLTALSCDAGILCEYQLRFRLLQFTSSSLLMGRQPQMVPVRRPLPSTWETRMELHAPALTWPLWPFGE